MGVFNVSFLRPGASKGGGGSYGVLVDQIAVLENNLASDGFLSPGDYDLLIKRAQDVASHPGLTNDQRSNLLVKISAYQEGKNTKALDAADDIARLNREVTDDTRNNTMRNANNPAQFLNARAASLRLKAERLGETIDQRTLSGADATAHDNELAATLQDLTDTLDAIDSVEGYAAAPSGKPIGNFVAYVETNARGEITAVEVGRPTSKSGYAETNALMQGLQVYGRVNRKEGGQNVFRLGNVDYKGSDLQIQDPTNPLAFRNAPLMAGDIKPGQFMAIESYQDVTPDQVTPQRVLRPGDYARGKEGTIYFSNPAGGYRKYKNMLPDQLGINPQTILDIPMNLEAGINAQSNETVDGMDSAFAPQSLPMGVYDKMQSSVPRPSAPATPAGAAAEAGGQSRTPAPMSRAPQSAPGLAQRTVQAAKGYISRVLS